MSQISWLLPGGEAAGRRNPKRATQSDSGQREREQWKMENVHWHLTWTRALMPDLWPVLGFNVWFGCDSMKEKVSQRTPKRSDILGDISLVHSVVEAFFFFIYFFLELHILEALISSPSSRSSESAERLTPLHSVWNQSKISAVVAHFEGQLIPSVQSAGFW